MRLAVAGVGWIPGSGLAIREEYSLFDAKNRFSLDVPPTTEPAGSLCAEILREAARPPECRLFRKACTPRSPVGPCMVSSEGTCAAYFKYHED